MKYIRTSEGICTWDCPIESLIGAHPKAYSDTIEELCDRAFAFHKDSKWGIPDLEDYSLSLLKEKILKETKNSINEFDFKLAIWTDKGLIYVAKLNDKGELELI